MRIKGRRSRVLSSHRWDNDPDILARTCRNRRQEIFATANFSGGPGWDRELSAPNVSLRVLPSGNYQKKSHTDTIDGFPIGVNDHAVLHQSPLCHGRITKPRYVNASYFFFFSCYKTDRIALTDKPLFRGGQFPDIKYQTTDVFSPQFSHEPSLRSTAMDIVTSCFLLPW